MKRLIVIPILLLCVLGIRAQMIVSPYMPWDQEGMTENNARLMENRLAQIINDSGLLSADCSRFLLTMNWNVVDKEVLSTAPTKVVYRLEAGVYMGDGMTGNKFASTVIPLKGVGNSEAKAIVNAMRGLSASRPEIAQVIKKGVQQILAYYESHKREIMTSVKTMMGMHDYEGDMFALYQIPMECSYYQEAQGMLVTAYKGMVNNDAAVLLQRARALWAASPSQENAEAVMALVGDIDPSSSSYNAAQSFMKEVKGRVSKLDDQDRAEVFKELAHERSMDKAHMQAVREICLAYAKNQPKVVYNIGSWW